MKVLSFGEILLRLASPGYTRLFQKDTLVTSFCGGEANVATSLSILGIESAFVTKLPRNAIGQAAINSMRYFGVDTHNILRGEGRMGIYYLEKGASQRASKIIYDREYSAISLAKREEFDWDNIFDGVNWFHWTGINPALSSELIDICEDACKVAKKRGITISCDLNYRGSLWSSEEAQLVMKKLISYVDVCIANEEDAQKVLGINISDNSIEDGCLNRKSYVDAAEEISKKYNCKYVAFTLRESYSASDNGWSGMLYNNQTKRAYFSKEYKIHIVDRVGGGDSFTAGLIYALVNKMKDKEAIEFAVAASCLKHTIEGDFNRVSLEEILNLLNGTGNGRVIR